jgi:hypothetical protein
MRAAEKSLRWTLVKQLGRSSLPLATTGRVSIALLGPISQFWGVTRALTYQPRGDGN